MKSNSWKKCGLVKESISRNKIMISNLKMSQIPKKSKFRGAKMVKNGSFWDLNMYNHNWFHVNSEWLEILWTSTLRFLSTLYAVYKPRWNQIHGKNCGLVKESISRKKSYFFQNKVPTDDYVFYLLFYAHMLRMKKKNSSLCQWFGTRICTIVPSIKAAMRRNIVQVFRIHFFVHSLHSVEKTKIYSHLKNISWNQLTAGLFVNG